MTNYRPVTLLPIVSKIFEKLIARTLTKQVAKVISREQHGFLPRRSVVIQLLLSLSKIYQTINAIDVTNRLVLLDFSKAFDKIKHSILLEKLLSLNLSKRSYNLIKDYLSDRTQSVRVNGVVSVNLKISSGVPQGSVVGPILFLLYINDLPLVVFSSMALLFADDLKLISKTATND